MIHPNEPRETPDWMPHAAECRTCGSRDWHHPDDCTGLDMPDCELGEN